MTGFTPYITFEGRCAEALYFYRDCFGGEIVFIQYYRESPAEVPEAFKDRIMHSEFKAGAVHFMASDATPGQTIQPGTNISLNVSFDEPGEQENVFRKLSAGGHIHMPLQDIYWGSRFGMLTDKFGLHWMLNCEIS